MGCIGSKNELKSSKSNSRTSLSQVRKSFFRGSTHDNALNTSSDAIIWSELIVGSNPKQNPVISEDNDNGIYIIRASYRRRPQQSPNLSTQSQSTNNLNNYGLLQTTPRAQEVLVKVFTRQKAHTDEDFESAYNDCKKETDLMQCAAEKITDTIACESNMFLVPALGVVRGVLPHTLTNKFGVPVGLEAIGLVLGYQGNSSLEVRLQQACDNKETLEISEKIRLLRDIAQGLWGLHSVGLIHGDLKPGNILLSTDTPPRALLSGFASSAERSGSNGINLSNIGSTTHQHGTPVYSAPEMLVNPYVSFTGRVAQSSRKTDMYAFALLAWELLSQQRAFADVNAESILCSRVHKGVRPPLELLPLETPTEIVALITACWDKERASRKSAQEAYMLLAVANHLNSNQSFDVYISHAPSARPTLDYVVAFLMQFGYRVWYDNSDSKNMSEETKAIITKCKVFILVLTKSYQETEFCMHDAQFVHQLNPAKVVVTLVMDDFPLKWCSEELAKLCDFQSGQEVNISSFVRNDSWLNGSCNHSFTSNSTSNSNKISIGSASPSGAAGSSPPAHEDYQGPTAESLSYLRRSLQPLMTDLKLAGCFRNPDTYNSS